uniref:C2H2-type domain-containing protein n=1 Tax=Parastrongyloides trichosuri TaxID=131310 RepID=A0A0N4ZUX8_PARTI
MTTKEPTNNQPIQQITTYNNVQPQQMVLLNGAQNQRVPYKIGNPIPINALNLQPVNAPTSGGQYYFIVQPHMASGQQIVMNGTQLVPISGAQTITIKSENCGDQSIIQTGDQQFLSQSIIIPQHIMTPTTSNSMDMNNSNMPINMGISNTNMHQMMPNQMNMKDSSIENSHPNEMPQLTPLENYHHEEQQLNQNGMMSNDMVPMQSQEMSKQDDLNQMRITLGNLQFQQDPNDPQKWIVITEGSNGPSSAAIQQTLVSNVIESMNQGSSSTSECPSPSSISMKESSFSSSTSRSAKRASGKRVPCECPNCVRNANVPREEKVAGHLCHLCNKKYSKVSHLKSHLRAHFNDRPYVCDWPNCPRKFTRSDELQRHRRIHTGEKKFFCNVCGKGFIRSDHKSKHSRVHDKKGETPRSLGILEEASMHI